MVVAAVRCPVLGGSGAWVAPQVSAITLPATALATASGKVVVVRIYLVYNREQLH